MKNSYFAQSVTLIRPAMMECIKTADSAEEKLIIIQEAHEDLRGAIEARETARRLGDLVFVDAEDVVIRRQDALYAVIALLTADEPGADNEPLE